MAWNPNIPTVTNRVQDDLNAIRANFQHLDPLAPYVQALLDSRIVEMGSNSNGTYVRWENGIQIAWLVQTNVAVYLATTTVQGLTVYYTNLAWTFPAAFTGIPAVVIEHDAAGVVERPGNEISPPNATSVIYSVSYLVNST